MDIRSVYPLFLKESLFCCICLKCTLVCLLLLFFYFSLKVTLLSLELVVFPLWGLGKQFLTGLTLEIFSLPPFSPHYSPLGLREHPLRLKMEQLTTSWRNLSLSEKEQTGFILPEDHRKGEFFIAAKFLTSCFLQMEVVARTFKQLWRMSNGFRVCNQGNNIVLFVFDNLMEVDKILKSQPWSFDKHLIIMQ